MNCILVIACLVVGFLLGRMGSRDYDGVIVFGENMTNFKLDFIMDLEDVAKCRAVMLKVEEEM